jgi:hypothetical protein
MVSPDQALQLVRKCLPKLEQSKKELNASDMKISTMCSLWSGMGHIYKVSLWGGQANLVIKHVAPPNPKRQSFGDKRKADSYQVEANFYDKLASSLIDDFNMNIPVPYLVEHGPAAGEITICMSLLEGKAMYDEVRVVLDWMAKFHAIYWGNEAIDQLVAEVGLQAVGSYWHLDTRPDEHQSMPRNGWEGRLKRAARAVDDCLKRDPMQCLIHGDTKDANILLLNGSSEVALYDFQYCGKGSPTRDLAYYLCTSSDHDNEDYAKHYYDQLVKNLSKNDSFFPPPTYKHFKDSLELALADFCRFMAGWGYWGDDVKGRVKELLDRLDGGKDLGSEEAYDEAIRREFW